MTSTWALTVSDVRLLSRESRYLYIGIEIIGGWGCLAVDRDRIQGSNGLAWCNITEICHGIGASKAA